ncbi:MAG: stalk domain-containing protein [Candidatus Xenobia bacterium]
MRTAWGRLLVMLMLCAGAALAQATGGINVTVNGTPVVFDQPPAMVSGSVMVPMRGVFNRLGADVVWDAPTRTIRATHGDTVIQLQLGAPTATINGQQRPLSTPAMEIGGRTMVPLRFVSEALGAEVKWDPATRTVAISTTAPAVTYTPTPQPGSTPIPGQAPNIFAVTTNGPANLHPGETVTVTMDGDANGNASFDIYGMVQRVPMQEVNPGHYTGSYQIPRDARPVQNAAVFGRLSLNGRESMMGAPGGLTIVAGHHEEHHGSIAPRNNEVVNTSRPNVVMVFEHPMAPGSVHLYINGIDVTPQSQINADLISWTPPQDLPPGPVTAYMTGTEADGDQVQKQWTFQVQPGGPMMGGGLNVGHTPAVPLAPGQLLTVQMQGPPHGFATFDLGAMHVGLPMTEQSPGMYVGQYQVQPGDVGQTLTVVGHVGISGQPPLTGTDPTPLTFGGMGGATGLVFTSPNPNVPVPDQFTISGQTAPNTPVAISVRVNTGGPLNFQGDVMNTTVRSGPDGNFSYPFQGQLPFRGGTWVITGQAQGPSGPMGQPVVINVPRQ